MSTGPDPARQEHSSTYVVQDRFKEEELQRLTIQDELMTTLMGGPLTEQTGAADMRRVLDVGSGSGRWVIAAARAYPEMSLIGIDISQRMVDYARKSAETSRLDNQVEFHAMDALRMLEFPTNYFDLVNLRFGVGYLRTWDWPKLIGEMLRVCRSGGVIRVTECEIGGYSNSPVLTQIYEMIVCALFRAGHLFEQKSSGLIDHLAPLLTRQGCQQVQSKRLAPKLQAGTPEAEALIQDISFMCRTTRPFLEKWGCLDKNYDTICQQALAETNGLEVIGGATVITAWGTRPHTTS